MIKKDCRQAFFVLVILFLATTIEAYGLLLIMLFCFLITALEGVTLEEIFMATRKIGRDAGTGKFKTVKSAQKDKKGSVVETIKTTPKSLQKKKGK